MNDVKKRFKQLEKAAGVSKRTRAEPVKFSQAMVNAYPAKTKPYKLFDKTVTGLRLYVGVSGTKSWSLIYSDRSNKRQTYRIGSTAQFNVMEARTEARKLFNQIAAGKDPAAKKRQQREFEKESKSRTLEKYLEGHYWDERLSKRKSGEATKQRILSTYKQFLDTDMANITPAQLNKLRTERYNAGIKPQTLNRDRAALHSLFAMAVKDKIINSNPADTEHHEILNEVDSKRVRYLGQHDEHSGYVDGERQRFLNALTTMPEQTQAIVGLIYNTGLRRGEALSLTWDAVSLSKRTVTIHAHYAKGDKRRDIGLNDAAVSILHSWKKSRGNIVRMNDLVFPNSRTGEKIKSLKTTWNTLVKRAEIDNFKLHDVRHDVASRLVMAGVSLYEVAAILGHSDVSMTQRYAHLAPEKLHKNMDVL